MSSPEQSDHCHKPAEMKKEPAAEAAGSSVGSRIRR
jgi:hypothetical protein